MRIMRMGMLGAGGVLALLSVVAFTREAPKKSCGAPRQKAQQSQGVKAERLRCSLTGRVVDACCCLEREGKTHCTLAGKDVATCCCRRVADESKQN